MNAANNARFTEHLVKKLKDGGQYQIVALEKCYRLDAAKLGHERV
jgi:hypothetical protein